MAITPVQSSRRNEEVSSPKILGVVLSDGLSVKDHVAETTSRSAIRLLRSRGMSPAALHEIPRATNVARLQYADPA